MTGLSPTLAQELNPRQDKLAVLALAFAARHEIIRQGRNLTLVRMTPDLICD